MRAVDRLRAWWHDAYFAAEATLGLDLAGRCQGVVDEINAPVANPTFAHRLRHRLHLSLCQGCVNFLRWHRILRKAASQNENHPHLDLKRIDRDMFKKFKPGDVL